MRLFWTILFPLLIGFPAYASATSACEHQLLTSELLEFDPEYTLQERIENILENLGKPTIDEVPKYFEGQQRWLVTVGAKYVPNFSSDRFSQILGEYRSTQILKWAFLGYLRGLAGQEVNISAGVEGLIFSDAGLSDEALQASQRGSRDSRREFLIQTIRVLTRGKSLSALKFPLTDFSPGNLRRSANLISQFADYCELAPTLDGDVADLKLHEEMSFAKREFLVRTALIQNMNSIAVAYGEPITVQQLDKIQQHWGDYLFWIRLGKVALQSNGNTDRLLAIMKSIANLENPKLSRPSGIDKTWLRPRSRVELVGDQSIIASLNVINPRVLANVGTLTGGASCISLQSCDHPQAIADLVGEPTEQLLVSYSLSERDFANQNDLAKIVATLKGGEDLQVIMLDDLRLEFYFGNNRVSTLPKFLAHYRLMLVLEEGIYPANESSQNHPAMVQMMRQVQELEKQIADEMNLPILKYRKRYR